MEHAHVRGSVGERPLADSPAQVFQKRTTFPLVAGGACRNCKFFRPACCHDQGTPAFSAHPKVEIVRVRCTTIRLRSASLHPGPCMSLSGQAAQWARSLSRGRFHRPLSARPSSSPDLAMYRAPLWWTQQFQFRTSKLSSPPRSSPVRLYVRALGPSGARTRPPALCVGQLLFRNRRTTTIASTQRTAGPARQILRRACRRACTDAGRVRSDAKAHRDRSEPYGHRSDGRV